MAQRQVVEPGVDVGHFERGRAEFALAEQHLRALRFAAHHQRRQQRGDRRRRGRRRGHCLFLISRRTQHADVGIGEQRDHADDRGNRPHPLPLCAELGLAAGFLRVAALAETAAARCQTSGTLRGGAARPGRERQVGAPCGDAAWPLAASHRQRFVDRVQRRGVVAAAGGLGGRHHFVLDDAAGRIRRRATGDAVVHDGAEGVDVRPRAETAAARVLLQRREAGGGNEQVRGPAAIAERLPGAAVDLPPAADFEQHRRAVFAHDDMAWADVLVQEAVAVQQLEGAEQGADDGVELLLRERRAAFEQLRQRFAFDVVHHHVAGAVGAQRPMHLDEVGVIDARLHPRFVEETAEAGVESLLVGARPRHHGGVVLACRHAVRQVLPDGDLAASVVVERLILDAVGAEAQNAAQLVLLQAVAVWQRVEVVRQFVLLQSARICLARGPSREDPTFTPTIAL